MSTAKCAQCGAMFHVEFERFSEAVLAGERLSCEVCQ